MRRLVNREFAPCNAPLTNRGEECESHYHIDQSDIDLFIRAFASQRAKAKVYISRKKKCRSAAKNSHANTARIQR